MIRIEPQPCRLLNQSGLWGWSPDSPPTWDSAVVRWRFDRCELMAPYGPGGAAVRVEGIWYWEGSPVICRNCGAALRPVTLCPRCCGLDAEEVLG